MSVFQNRQSRRLLAICSERPVYHFISASFKTWHDDSHIVFIIIWSYICICIYLIYSYIKLKNQAFWTCFGNIPEISWDTTKADSNFVRFGQQKCSPGNWVSAVHEQSRCPESASEFQDVTVIIPNNIIPSRQTGTRTQYRCSAKLLVIEEISNEIFGIARNNIVPGSLEETGFGRSTRSSIAASGVPHLWPKPEGARMLVPDGAEQ